jgi:hypothetical protein
MVKKKSEKLRSTLQPQEDDFQLNTLHLIPYKNIATS